MDGLKVELTLTPAMLEEIAAQVAAQLSDHVRGDGSPWLDIHGAAAYTGIPASTIYKNKAILRHKPDGRLMFHRAELDAYMRGEA